MEENWRIDTEERRKELSEGWRREGKKGYMRRKRREEKKGVREVGREAALTITDNRKILTHTQKNFLLDFRFLYLLSVSCVVTSLSLFYLFYLSFIC